MNLISSKSLHGEIFWQRSIKMDIIFKIVAVIIAIGLAYGGWLLKREINYSMDYKDKVIQTIREEQKPLLQRIKTLENEVKILKGTK